MTYLTIEEFARKIAEHENIDKAIVRVERVIKAQKGFESSTTDKYRMTLYANPDTVGDSIGAEDVAQFTINRQDGRDIVIGATFGPFTPYWAAEAIIAVRDAS